MDKLRVLLCFLVMGMLVFAASLVRDRLGQSELDLAKSNARPLSAPTTVADARSNRTLDALLDEAKVLSIDTLAGQSWEVACFNQGDAIVPASGMVSCWPAETDLNLGGAYLNVRSSDGGCSQWRSIKPVIHRRFHGALCLGREDVPGLAVRARAELVDIE